MQFLPGPDPGTGAVRADDRPPGGRHHPGPLGAGELRFFIALPVPYPLGIRGREPAGGAGELCLGGQLPGGLHGGGVPVRPGPSGYPLLWPPPGEHYPSDPGGGLRRRLPGSGAGAAVLQQHLSRDLH